MACQADRADQILLGVLDDVLSADVAIVELDGFRHVVDGKVIAKQGVWIGLDLKLLHLAAQRQNFGHSGNGLQVELDDPVLDFAQLFRGALALVFEKIEEDLAEAGADRPHLWLAESLWKLVPGDLQALVDELPREIGVEPIFEVDIDNGQAEIGDRPDLLKPGQAVHRHFDRVGDVALDLLRRQAFGFREYLDQGRRHVGEGIDRQADVAEDAGAENTRRKRKH